jgi:Fe-S cluster assembly iron-binding protein IscA
MLYDLALSHCKVLTSTQINMLLTDKAGVTSLNATNTNLSNNYYNKTQIDAMITTTGSTDLTNYYNKTQIDAITTSFLNETQVENEISTAFDNVAPNLVFWNATLNANSFNYALPYDATFVDTTSALNVASDSYKIVPSKKIHSFVTSSISTKANTSDLTTTNTNVTNLTNNLSTNYYNKTQIDGMVGGSGSSFDIYNNSVNFNVTHSTGTGYFYYNINLLDNNTDYVGKMHMLIDQNIKITNTTDNTGEEDLNSCRLALDPLDAGGFVLQIGHNFINGKNYNISGFVFYALINANERTNITKSIDYLSKKINKR